MILLGNILLVVAALLVIALGRLQLSGMPSGDGGVGYAFVMLLWNAALIVVLLAVTGVLIAVDRAPPLPFATTHRTVFTLAFVGLTTIFAATAIVASPSGAPTPWSMSAVLRLTPLVIPALLIVSAAIQLRGSQPGQATPALVSLSLAVVTCISVACIGVAMAPFVMNKARNSMVVAARDPNALDENQERILADIEAADSIGGLMTFLQFSGGGQHPKVRERAVARLNAIPDWEKRVGDRLSDDDVDEVLGFLAANDVPDPASIAALLPKGIIQTAKNVRARVRRANHPSHMYDGLMVFEVDRVIKCATKFKEFGVDYRPAMRELRAAFDERSPYSRPTFDGAKLVDKWLKKNQQ